MGSLAHTGGSSAQRAIAAAGAMPIFMRLASSESGPVVLESGPWTLQAYAADALASVIRGQQDLTEAFVAAGGVPLMLRLLLHGSTELLQRCGAQLAAGVMARPYSWRRDAQTALVEAGGIPILVQLMGREPVDSAVTALGCVINGRREYQLAAVTAGAAPVLARRLLSNSPSLLPGPVVTVGNLAAGSPAGRAALVAAGVIPPLVQMLADDAMRLMAAAALANLAASPDLEHRQAVVVAGAIPSLVRCLQANDAAALCIVHALWTMAAGSPDHALAVEAAGAVPILQSLLETSRSEDIKRFASYALHAITSAAAQAQQPAPAASPPPPAATSAGPAAARVCAGCGTTRGLRLCAACRTVRYCSEACSYSHWRQHRAECRRLQAEQAQAAGGGEGAVAQL